MDFPPLETEWGLAGFAGSVDRALPFSNHRYRQNKLLLQMQFLRMPDHDKGKRPSGAVLDSIPGFGDHQTDYCFCSEVFEFVSGGAHGRAGSENVIYE